MQLLTPQILAGMTQNSGRLFSANLPLPDYGRVARYSETIARVSGFATPRGSRSRLVIRGTHAGPDHLVVEVVHLRGRRGHPVIDPP